MYEPYSKETASPTDRVAWVLCQIIDDDAPMRWTRYRFAVDCIVRNAEVMRDLNTSAAALAAQLAARMDALESAALKATPHP